MEGFQEQFKRKRDGSNLLHLAADDDVAGFRFEVEERGFDVDDVSLWYGRRIGSKKMGFEERTPLMIASRYGSTQVLNYIIETGKVDLNRACDSDGVTALHCAAAGGSDSAIETVKLLLGASANPNSVDADGNRPGDLIAPYVKNSSKSIRRRLEILLNGGELDVEEENTIPQSLLKEGSEKKEYPSDVCLPDINIGVYGSDEFRMYSFKVKPCSRAYSHDWTECPFVHPGENARRRDPRKYNYTCVPCPEFRKGTCVKGDGCEYAHGVFESWLHPAQYRTRLCKDEIGCSRKVCFFAHKVEELRPLYASTGSAMPSPKSLSVSSMDMAALSPLGIGSTPPMSPSAACSSPMWQNKVSLTPPTLQLPGSRLKAAVSARDLELEMELLGLESIRTQQQQRQQLIDDLTGLSSPWNKDYNRFGDLKPTNLDSVYGSLDSSYLSQLQGLSLSPKVSTATTTTTAQLQSPTGHQMRQNMNQLRSSYPSNLSSSPVRKPSPSAYGFDSSAAVAAAVMNSRSAAFAKRSQSFVDRGAVSSHRNGFNAAANSANPANMMSNWGSPDGKLEWGYNGDDLSKLKKSASFGFRSGNGNAATRTAMNPASAGEPDVSWVHSLVKDVSSVGAGLYSSEQNHGSVHEKLPPWVEQFYMEQEQMVA